MYSGAARERDWTTGSQKHAWDTTNDYDFQYQDATNYQHTGACVGPHRGVKDTRRPPMRPAWGSEQMTDNKSAEDASWQSCMFDLGISQLLWWFIILVVISVFINVTTVIQLRNLSHDIKRGGMFGVNI